MQLLDEVKIQVPTGTAVVQLLQGDLSAIPKEHEADILVISAFPDDYTALPGSLIAALEEKGLVVGELARHKAVDMTHNMGCWLSQPLNIQQQQQFHFRQLLCFEPRREAGTPDQVVGNIFRCINNFAFDDDNNVVAMQVLAIGRQKMPMEKMLPAMFEASVFWLETGIPLDAIKFVVHNPNDVAAASNTFLKAKKEYLSPRPVKDVLPATLERAKPLSKKQEILPGKFEKYTNLAGSMMASEDAELCEASPSYKKKPFDIEPPDSQSAEAAAQAPLPAPAEYDFFISYSHSHGQQVEEFVTALKTVNSNWNIFYDKSSIPPGGQWIKMISDAIQRSRCVVCLLSPQYRDSPVCWDEFQCAKAKEYRTRKPVIRTINFLRDDDMPLIMSVYSYIDCTEGDMKKLKDAVEFLH